MCSYYIIFWDMRLYTVLEVRVQHIVAYSILNIRFQKEAWVNCMGHSPAAVGGNEAVFLFNRRTNKMRVLLGVQQFCVLGSLPQKRNRKSLYMQRFYQVFQHFFTAELVQSVKRLLPSTTHADDSQGSPNYGSEPQIWKGTLSTKNAECSVEQTCVQHN